MSKTYKKRVHGNNKKIYLETLKSVLGRSILHYSHLFHIIILSYRMVLILLLLLCNRDNLILKPIVYLEKFGKNYYSMYVEEGRWVYAQILLSNC